VTEAAAAHQLAANSASAPAAPCSLPLAVAAPADDVLLMQKLNAGKVSIVVGSVNVRAVLTAACRQIGVTCRERNL